VSGVGCAMAVWLCGGLAAGPQVMGAHFEGCVKALCTCNSPHSTHVWGDSLDITGTRRGVQAPWGTTTACMLHCTHSCKVVTQPLAGDRSTVTTSQ